MRFRNDNGGHSAEHSQLATMANNTELINAFSTPILTREYVDSSEVNHELEAEILKRLQVEKGVRQSGVQCWDSKKTLLAWPLKSVAILERWIFSSVADLTEIVTGKAFDQQRCTMHAHAWASVSFRGGYRKPHSHRLASWSGVYYVAAEPATPECNPESGRLGFIDPRSLPLQIGFPPSSFGGSISLAPKAGRMVLFPGWLKHYVNPHEHEGKRISIAFNILLSYPQAAGRVSKMKQISPG